MVALVDRGVVEEDGERLRPVLLPQLLEEVADVLPLVAPADEELVVDEGAPDFETEVRLLHTPFTIP